MVFIFIFFNFLGAVLVWGGSGVVANPGWRCFPLLFASPGRIFEEVMVMVMVEEPNLKVQVRFCFNLPSLDLSQVRF